MNKDGGSWAGFLIMAFVVVGLIGGMATFAAQIPFERALARDAALTEAEHAAAAPDAPARLAALRDALGDSAEHVLTAQNTPLPDFPARIAAERHRMLAAFGDEARSAGAHLRLVLAIFTVMSAVFGVVVLRVARRGAETPRG